MGRVVRLMRTASLGEAGRGESADSSTDRRSAWVKDLVLAISVSNTVLPVGLSQRDSSKQCSAIRGRALIDPVGDEMAFDLDLRALKGETGDGELVPALDECDSVSVSVKIPSIAVACKLLIVDTDESLECVVKLDDAKEERLLWLSDNLCLDKPVCSSTGDS